MLISTSFSRAVIVEISAALMSIQFSPNDTMLTESDNWKTCSRVGLSTSSRPKIMSHEYM